MAASLTPYTVQTGEASNYAKFDGLVTTIAGSLAAIGDQSQNAWFAGQILAPSQISQGGASSGQALVWSGSSWVPTTLKTRQVATNTTTQDVVNTTTPTDLLTGAALGANVGLSVLSPSQIGSTTSFHLVAGGDYLNNSAGARSLTLSWGIGNSAGASKGWEDSIGASIGLSATRRAWHLYVNATPTTIVAGSYLLEGTGFFSMSDNAAATTGSGGLKTPTNTQFGFAFRGQPGGNVAETCHMFFGCTHDTASANVSMRCLYARSEVTN